MTDKMLLQSVINHPVHILTDEGDFSPSSFIPFCSFGEKMLGNKTKGFDIPICNIFKPTNYLDQLCYETNLMDLKDIDSKKVEKQLEIGLTLILDYNEERQIYQTIQKNEPNLMNGFYQNSNDDISIHLDTISLLKIYSLKIFFIFLILDPVGLYGEGQYNLQSMKEISVTDSFMGLDKNTIKCQNIEKLTSCKTRIHIENMRQECGCLPISIKLSERVK